MKTQLKVVQSFLSGVPRAKICKILCQQAGLSQLHAIEFYSRVRFCDPMGYILSDAVAEIIPSVIEELKLTPQNVWVMDDYAKLTWIAGKAETHQFSPAIINRLQEHMAHKRPATIAKWQPVLNEWRAMSPLLYVAA